MITITTIEAIVAEAVARERELMECGHSRACLYQANDLGEPGTASCAWCESLATAREKEREACCEAIRANCTGCNGTGVGGWESHPDGQHAQAVECEYCGRPIAAIRARGGAAETRGEE